MFDLNLYEAFDELDKLYESKPTIVYPAAAPDISSARSIDTDVIDIRDEIETNTCIMYSPKDDMEPILTRLQVRTIITRDFKDGKKVLCKIGRSGKVYLPGGGFDLNKDKSFIDTAKREAWEEFNINLTNVNDNHLYSWSYREDSFVANHVANPADRWSGYLTILIVGEYESTSNNTKPEEKNKWHWEPISVLDSNPFYKAGLNALNEAVYPRNEVDPNMSDISYMVSSPNAVAQLLVKPEIKKTFLKEVIAGSFDSDTINTFIDKKVNPDRSDPLLAAGNTAHYSISTSTNVGGHADRRADKWGFGLIIDGKELSRYYNFYDFAHTANEFLKCEIIRLVALNTPRTFTLNKQNISAYYYMKVANYGNWYHLDKEWFDKIVNTILNPTATRRKATNNQNATLEAYDLERDIAINANRLFKKKYNIDPNVLASGDSADICDYIRQHAAELSWINNEALTINGTLAEPIDSKAVYKFKDPAGFRKIGNPISFIDLYRAWGKDEFGKFRTWLQTNSRFNEYEKRLWLANPNIQYVELPAKAIKGLVLPRVFESDWKKETPEVPALAYIKNRLKELGVNNPEIKYHDNIDSSYDDILNNKPALDIIEKNMDYFEKQIKDLSAILKEAEAIYTDARNIKQRGRKLDQLAYFDVNNSANFTPALKNSFIYKVYNSSLSGSKMDLQQLVANDTVYNCIKYNINKYMFYLTADNYDESYNAALTATKNQVKTLFGNLINCSSFKDAYNYLPEAFAYYAPSRPDWENGDISNMPEASWKFDNIDDLLAF